MALDNIRRVVTGHDTEGKAVLVSDAGLPTVVDIDAIPGTRFHEVWSTAATPVVIDNGEDPTLGALRLPPPANGTRIRFVDIPPDSQEFMRDGAERMSAAFAQVGDRDASTVKATSPHPLMHRTETVDYGVVIEGDIVLVLDDSEVVLRSGNVVIQRGTNHAWANRSGKPCRMLFVLVDGQYESELAEALGQR
ncbi:MAG: cupin [Oceanospirillaceae bacterium]|nr:cupin [Oceanospirillaceae bacterium]